MREGQETINMRQQYNCSFILMKKEKQETQQMASPLGQNHCIYAGQKHSTAKSVWQVRVLQIRPRFCFIICFVFINYTII